MEVEELPLETAIEWGVEPHPWRGFSWLDKLIAVTLPLLAAGAFVLPFLDHAMLRRLARLPVVGGISEWLVNSNGWWLAGLGLLLAWVGFLLFKRWRISGDEHLWVDAGCPQCQERDLVRVSRERRDRWYGLLGIPAFRYACRNCTWRGLRVARRHRHLVLAQEQQIKASSLTLEAAGAGAATALADMDFEDLAPDRDEIMADIAELASVEDWDDDMEPVKSAADEDIEPHIPAEAEALDMPEPQPDRDNEDTAAVEGQPTSDDLDWLWRKLSDEA